mmetsp:Transcript_127784/g.238881  ORF Transcript_127784/g.238881 Transcript_127784/m.238881 type:complete len:447 (-) Transcript_127784:97-1437(-)
MADILNGLSDHSCFAPLSGGQSIQLARHLSDQIRTLEATVESLRRDLEKTNDNVASMQRGMLVTEASVHTLQESQRKTNDFTDKARQEMTRLDKRSRQLQQGVEQLQEALAPVKEGSQLMQTRFQVFERQINTAEEKIKELELGLELNFSADKSDRGKVEEELQRFWERYSKTVAQVDQQREGQRTLDTGVREMKHDIERAFGVAQSLEDRGTEQSKMVGVMNQQLQDLATKAQKLVEDHDVTKAQAADNKSTMKNINAQVDRLGESLNKTNGGLQNAQHQLGQTRKTMEDHKDRMRRAEHELERLSSGHLHANNSLRSLAIGLEETNNVALQVKAGLKETNSMVLPNITMDTSSAGVLGTTAYTDLSSSGGIRLSGSDWRGRPTSKSRTYKSPNNGTPRVRPADMGRAGADMTMLPTQMQPQPASVEDNPTGAGEQQMNSAWGGY